MIILSILFFITAILYSSVGFGGGSTYLALLLIWDVPFYIFPVLALICNIIVVSGNSINYIRAGNLDLKILMPYLMGSIPFAFIGGSISLDKEVFETNFWCPVRCIQAALPTMRAQRSGHIVQVSSIAGRIGLPAQPIYSASKWALEGLSENLAHDLSSFGVRVSIIEPGVTRTAILGKNNTVPDNDDFKEVYARMLDMYMEGIEANVKPEEVSETILSCLETPNGQLRWPVAWGAETMVNARHDGSVSDTEWTEIGSLVNDREKWVSSFKQAFNL